MESKSEKARAQWRRAAQAVLAATRRDQDLTQEQLASRVGWTRNNIADLEGGRKKFEVADLIVIAKALRVPPEVFFRRVLSWDDER